ncbi:hypothetical protein MD535_23820 [Vibrio sp. ZSDZ65]|uniref:Uncharacterized protein n=1 Tax=Vibrio qingdaonensis TaxID=2829491 RepID=A0A9X3CTA3_9VIBR|nr:hypothetical protein [Vibrio qingdaonensis]MCW8349023.1 hypothetical protein [Vibrio qingdaonensis]
MSVKSTTHHLVNLQYCLQEHSFLFNSKLLASALSGVMKSQTIRKAEFNSIHGMRNHILNMTNECMKRYRGVDSSLINAACIEIIRDVRSLVAVAKSDGF